MSAGSSPLSANGFYLVRFDMCLVDLGHNRRDVLKSFFLERALGGGVNEKMKKVACQLRDEDTQPRRPVNRAHEVKWFQDQQT